MGRTVFIVGAGASSEADLPTGDRLKQKISDLLNYKSSQSSITRVTGGDSLIYNALKQHSYNTGHPENINKYLQAALHIREALPQAPSIDNFIDTHSGNEPIETVGKLAIVRAILEAEKNSPSLYIDPSNIYNKMDFAALEHTWYGRFIKILHCRKDSLSSRLSNITFIVFNYDRCIEHYLYHSFINYYRITPDEARKLVNEIKIYHPYGVVGRLPWQAKESTDKNGLINFGITPDERQLLALVKQIKTFTEGTNADESQIEDIHLTVSDADTLVFLGFAFHDLNMEIIAPDPVIGDLERDVSLFATAKGFSDHDVSIISEKLRTGYRLKKENIHIKKDLKCFDLFTTYSRSLTLN